MSVVDFYANNPELLEGEPIEPPPEGLERISERTRPMLLEEPQSGRREEVSDPIEVRARLAAGWRWIMQRSDILESIHLQAWYFQVRHFPRLKWALLRAPGSSRFVIGDRGVAWVVDGYADPPPAALRAPGAMVVAPLTMHLALVGSSSGAKLGFSADEVNLITAFASSNWIAGPTEQSVRKALDDRRLYGGGSLH
jgi:hypothetical protein